jgi:hypothetical protein
MEWEKQVSFFPKGTLVKAHYGSMKNCVGIVMPRQEKLKEKSIMSSYPIYVMLLCGPLGSYYGQSWTLTKVDTTILAYKLPKGEWIKVNQPGGSLIMDFDDEEIEDADSDDSEDEG